MLMPHAWFTLNVHVYAGAHASMCSYKLVFTFAVVLSILFHHRLYSSVVERQSCKLKVLGSIPSGGFACNDAVCMEAPHSSPENFMKTEIELFWRASWTHPFLFGPVA